MLSEGHIASKWNPGLNPVVSSSTAVSRTPCLSSLWASVQVIKSSLFVFTELHAENLKNEDDVNTGLLGMDLTVTWFLSSLLFFMF